MKRMLNMLSHVWTAYRSLGLLNTVWEFIRDHYDDFL